MQDPLVWIDLEMSGLDPDEHVIVEIAVVVTDGRLEEVAEGPDLVIHQVDAALDQMEDVVRKMHQDSGLLDAIRDSDVTLAQAEDAALTFVRRHVPDAATAPLAGNSIATDRMFLRRHMPKLEAYLHYRNVDVSTVKELVRRWHPEQFAAAPRKAGGHRALADILESIAELRYYRDSVFR